MTPAYSFRPSIFGRTELEAVLEADSLVLKRGTGARRISFADIAAIRLFAAPMVGGQDSFACSIIPRTGRAAMLRSTSFLGPGRFEYRSAAYRAFAAALISRVAAANPSVTIIAGQSTVAWVLYLLILAGAGIVLLAGAIGAIGGALAPASLPPFIVILIFVPQIWRLVRRGPPRKIDSTMIEAVLPPVAR